MNYRAISVCVLAALCLWSAAGAYGQTEIFDPKRGWAEFERVLRSHYAYLERPGREEVEEQLARSRALAAEVENPSELRRLLHQTALTFADPHLIVGPFDEYDYSIIFTHADLRVEFSNGRFVVADVKAGSAAAATGIRPGWNVTEVEGVAADRAALLPFARVLADPTPVQRSYGATLVANGLRNRQRTLGFVKPDGDRLTLELPSPSQQYDSEPGRDTLSVRRIGADRSVGLVRFNNSLGQHETIAAFDEAISNLRNAEGIILDLRDTPSGGNTDVARSIIGHFLQEARPYQIHEIPAVERELGVPRRFIELALPRRPHFDQPLVVLHGTWTGSMGEGLVIGLDSAADAFTIGSDMGDLLGALWNFDLELSDSRLDMGAERLFHVDGRPREDFVADLPMPYADTSPDGSDPLIAAAMEHLGVMVGGRASR